MSPDLNSLPPSRPSPPSAGLQSSPRRRSTAGMHLNLNSDSQIPAVGDLSLSEHRSSISQALRTASPASISGSPIIATGDPHHQRTPSLGEIHQELEQEQEAQVNRLLQMIRTQQAQLQQLQQQQQQQQQPSSQPSSSSAVLDDTTPAERTVPFPSIPPLPSAGSSRVSTQLHPRGSRASSLATSPSLRPVVSLPPAAGGDILDTGATSGANTHDHTRRSSRDESAFYQAEAAMLTRENQMLRQRIRELERQIRDLTSQTASDESAPESHDKTEGNM
ncbi:hypothetical protein ASPZODRAFT_132103 [Penicilliopsis zonata CBS 506.65]|uniref:BZIP domain-containing protein n=1 Tax=Penicilliopsis zonata CBS 506.65 TaxID=1073090 RepID=A0A1L9SIX3_9EURO|nr:hypothetical protein ASPZODRAFT_132103 [Penicilliopsis zonata CBS 506.65]OJJ47148.1 hypothetical protein ASPZODRAFT_132103 [Penicilliopsis zonata CBS 506.65]